MYHEIFTMSQIFDDKQMASSVHNTNIRVLYLWNYSMNFYQIKSNRNYKYLFFNSINIIFLA